MTNNALRNREILSNVMINREKMAHDKAEKAKDRKSAEYRDITSAQIGAAGRIGSSALKFANSPEWYKRWPDLGKIIGKGVVPTFVQNNVVYQNGAIRMPATVVFFYNDVYGSIETMSGLTVPPELLPINEAALRYQTDLYSYNSVLATVAASDVMEYTLSACDLVVLYALVARALHAYKTFDPDTPLSNEALVRAAGWDVADMKANYKDIVSWLCTEITSFNNDIALPADLSILERKWFLAGGCWGEDYGKNSAIYFARPISYHIWNEVAGRLEANRYPQFLDFASVMYIHQQIKSRLVGSSNIVELVRNIKSGVKNGLKLVEVPMFEEGSLAIFPVDEVLEQITNAVCIPKLDWRGYPYYLEYTNATNFFSSSGPALYHLGQDSAGYLLPSNSLTITGAERYTPYQVSSGPSTASETDIDPGMLNFLHDEVSVDDLIVGTRLYAIPHLSATPTLTKIQVKHCGTEVLLGVLFDDGYSAANDIIYFPTADAVYNIMRKAYPMRAFPMLIHYVGNSGLQDVDQDWHSMVTIDNKTLYQLNKGAVLSEFYIGPKGSDNLKYATDNSNNRSYRNKGNKKNKGKDKPKDKAPDKAE